MHNEPESNSSTRDLRRLIDQARKKPSESCQYADEKHWHRINRYSGLDDDSKTIAKYELLRDLFTLTETNLYCCC